MKLKEKYNWDAILIFLSLAAFWFTVMLLVTGCNAYKYNRTFKNYNTEGLTHQGTSVYYNGKKAATLKSVEVAYDDGKIVHEASFDLTSSEFNNIAIPIIKYASKHFQHKNWEIEVELKQ